MSKPIDGKSYKQRHKMKLRYFVSIKLSQYHKNTYKYTGLCKISVGRVDVTFSSQVGGSVRNWSLTTVLGAKVRNVCCILAKLLHFRKITTENFSTLTTQLSGDFQHHKYTQSVCAIASASTRIFEDDTYFHFWNTVVSKNYYYAPNLDFNKNSYKYFDTMQYCIAKEIFSRA